MILHEKSEKNRKMNLIRGKKKNIWIAALLLSLLFAAVALTGCGEDGPEDKAYLPARERIFLEPEPGRYCMAEAVYPLNYDGSMPLIAMGHGFKGTLNSGGASELAERLARAGFASIRMDFNPHISPKKSAAKTNMYDLGSMKEAMLCGIRYMQDNYSIDPERIGLYARSMGGRVVMTMANENYGDIQYRALAMVAPAGNKDAMIHYAGGQQKWDKMKEKARNEGLVEYQGLKLTEAWFAEFEAYNPCDFGYKFGDNPVLVICNTLDHVVTEDTSLECAHAYENSRVITVTTEDRHGYEMSYENSDLKDYLMDEILSFFRSYMR